MNRKDHDLDTLLRQNAERQLAKFDWEEFGRRMDRRVTTAPAWSRSWNRYDKWVALAAGIALTAGVLIFAIPEATGPGRVASVQGEAKVTMIETTRPRGTAQVSFTRAERPVRCELRILTSDKPRQESQTPARWCIVAGQGLSAEKHRNGGDASDILCLF